MRYYQFQNGKHIPFQVQETEITCIIGKRDQRIYQWSITTTATKRTSAMSPQMISYQLNNTLLNL